MVEAESPPASLPSNAISAPRHWRNCWTNSRAKIAGDTEDPILLERARA